MRFLKKIHDQYPAIYSILIERDRVMFDTHQLEEWGLEGLPTPGMARRGWSRKALKAGDKIEFDIFPLKNGANGVPTATKSAPSHVMPE